MVEVLRLAAVASDDPADVVAICRDPNDDYLIALAHAADAHVLVSSVRDLTSITGYEPPIVTPRRFLGTLEMHGLTVSRPTASMGAAKRGDRGRRAMARPRHDA